MSILFPSVDAVTKLFPEPTMAAIRAYVAPAVTVSVDPNSPDILIFTTTP